MILDKGLSGGAGVCHGFRMRLKAIWCLGVWAATLVAGPADDVARIHIEAIGGKERIEAVGALRASGRVTTSGRMVRFRMLAARPNQVRIETESGGRTLVQSYDGKNPPWEMDTAGNPPVARAMRETATAMFLRDAEFDDPLVGGEARGYRLDAAGEFTIDGRRLTKILVTQNGGAPFFIYVDAETFLIVLRVDVRKQASGRDAEVVTRFDRFRPVNGVLLPHLIEVSLDGEVVQATVIDGMDANPKLTAGIFTRPETAAEKKEREERARSKAGRSLFRE